MVNKMSRFIKNFIKKETLAHDDHMTKIIQQKLSVTFLHLQQVNI